MSSLRLLVPVGRPIWSLVAAAGAPNGVRDRTGPEPAWAVSGAKASQSRRTTAVKPKPEVARTTPKSQYKSMARFKELGPLGAMQNCGGHVRFGR
jgi:hypothetical protein